MVEATVEKIESRAVSESPRGPSGKAAEGLRPPWCLL